MEYCIILVQNQVSFLNNVLALRHFKAYSALSLQTSRHQFPSFWQGRRTIFLYRTALISRATADMHALRA